MMRRITLSQVMTTTVSIARRLSTKPSSSLRNLVKPFLLKCHPDVQSNESNKQINLQAVQNLNSYLDALERIQTLGKVVAQDAQPVDIDFVMVHETVMGRKRTERTSRRQVRLRPPKIASEQAAREVAKVLQVANLPVPEDLSVIENDATDASRTEDLSPFERSRQRFVRRINHTKLKEQYQKAVADMRADLATWGTTARGDRQWMVAQILARVRVEDASLSIADQLSALRRLGILLERHYDTLQLEDAGYFWEEQSTIVLTAARNKSGSALHKQGTNGFSFRLNEDSKTFSMMVPMDFTEKELLEELEQNVWDFKYIVEDKLEDILDKDEET